MYSFKTIKERGGEKRELTVTHNGMWEEWDQHLFFFCYKMISRFKNVQFPVETTQQLSKMPSLKQWQESFLWTLISALSPRHPFPLSEDWFYRFLYEIFYIYAWDSSALFSAESQIQELREHHLLLFPHLHCSSGSECFLVTRADISCLIWRLWSEQEQRQKRW